MAAYRFFDNASIDWRAIMAPHWEQTAKRMAEQPVVLCLQDTTELLCAAAHKSSDAGRIVMRSTIRPGSALGSIRLPFSPHKGCQI